MKLLAFLFVGLAASPSIAREVPTQASSCLKAAASLTFPSDRAKASLQCIRLHLNSLDMSNCHEIANAMTYESDSDLVYRACAPSELISLNECMTMAGFAIYPSNRDEILLSCQRYKTSTVEQCLSMNRFMSYESNRDKGVQQCAQK